MARPSVASLNSLAEVLRQAQPLYNQCRSILSYLDGNCDSDEERLPDDAAMPSIDAEARNDAGSISHTVLEPIGRQRRRAC